MRDGIPNFYWGFRSAWTVAHLVLLVVLAIWLASWLMTDGRGAQLYYEGSWWLEDLSQQLASWIPFPWNA